MFELYLYSQFYLLRIKIHSRLKFLPLLYMLIFLLHLASFISLILGFDKYMLHRMGAGRKKKTLSLKEKPHPSCTMNYSAPARNLRKRDLGAVIFGCKHNTIGECYSKLLFG